MYETSGFEDEFPFLCDDCLAMTLIAMGRELLRWYPKTRQLAKRESSS